MENKFKSIKKIVFYIAAIFIFTSLLAAEETPTYVAATFTLENVNEIQKYNFKMYLLIKAENKKNAPKPKFGYRILKTFPVSVREFTFSAPYLDYLNKAFKEKADLIISSLPEYRKKNAYYVSGLVYNFVKENVKEGIFGEKPIINPHKLFLSGVEVLNRQEGCLLEKCRAAVTLLRYYSIPAVIVMWRDHYAVEYFLKPLDTKGKWYVMDFKDEYKEEDPFIEPAEWQPLNSKELLNEDWQDSEIFVKNKSIKNLYLYNKEEAFSTYDSITSSSNDYNSNNTSENLQSKKPFYLLKIVDYEIWMKKGSKTEVKFILPFNNIDFFKTMKFLVKSENNNLIIKCKRVLHYVVPPQEGMVHMLPVEFYSNVTRTTTY